MLPALKTVCHSIKALQDSEAAVKSKYHVAISGLSMIWERYPRLIHTCIIDIRTSCMGYRHGASELRMAQARNIYLKQSLIYWR